MKWQIKSSIQTAFSALPYGESINYSAQLAMGSHSEGSLLAGFARQRDRLNALVDQRKINRETAVEIGTGWNGAGIMVLALERFRTIHTYDSVRHLRFSLVRRLLKAIERNHPELVSRLPAMFAARTLDGFLRAANAHYHAPGDASVTGLPDKSVDLVFSYDVMEHIPPVMLERITAETARIVRGVACHRIIPGDHIGPTAVHFLGLSPLVWRLVNSRLAYHNRLRACHFVEIFERHGGRIFTKRESVSPKDIEAAKVLPRNPFPDLTARQLAVNLLDVDVAFEAS